MTRSSDFAKTILLAAVPGSKKDRRRTSRSTSVLSVRDTGWIISFMIYGFRLWGKDENQEVKPSRSRQTGAGETVRATEDGERNME